MIEPFIDLKQQIVHEGDFIMYPVNTFIRCAVVAKLLNPGTLRAKYVRQKYYNVQQGTHEVKTQIVCLGHRSVIKISLDELKLILSPAEYIFLMDVHEELQEKRYAKA